MPEEMAGTDVWARLLAETRQALATLRVEELEQLAARAEQMLAAAGRGLQPATQSIARLSARPAMHSAGSLAAGRTGSLARSPVTRSTVSCAENTVRVASEHRLLGDLLLATGRNLEVLRRLRNRMQDRMQAGEGNARWEL